MRLHNALRKTRLVLVGDVDQLPPVGPGKPFADLIASGHVPVARLTEVHRSKAESWVCTQAPRVLRGELPDMRGPRGDFAWHPVPSVADVVGKVVALARAADEAGRELQVLAPQRGGLAGVDALNRSLQAALNPQRPGAASWGRKEERIYLGDRVIQTSNDYRLEVMNGEVGDVDKLTDSELVVDFGDGRRVTYTKPASKALHLAYALTTHKSQGSEWPWVCVVAHSTHTFMLSRALFYTAITRARDGVLLVGDEEGVRHAVKNARDASRNSSLVMRLEEGGAA